MNYIFTEFYLRLIFLVFGACMGSFISMASHRLPRKQSLLSKRSYCPHCLKTLHVKSLIPIFSWIFQKGRCAHCKEPIGIKYLLTEIVTAVLFLLTYLRFGLSWNVVIVCALLVALIIATTTDLHEGIIPDSLQIFMAVLAFLYIIVNNISMAERLTSSVVYFTLIYIISEGLSRIKKQDVIGGGDVKLITIAGLFLGMKLIANFLFISGFAGLILGLSWQKFTGKKRFPFGPALATSLYLCLYLYH